MLNLDGKNILVVEDEEMNFIYLKQIFKLTKGNIQRVKTGESAIDACKNNSFDIVLMDIQLPDISGKEATIAIRKFDKEVPIIAQTACRTPDELDAVLDSGCNDVLVKPFKIEDFNKIVGKYLP